MFNKIIKSNCEITFPFSPLYCFIANTKIICNLLFLHTISLGN